MLVLGVLPCLALWGWWCQIGVAADGAYWLLEIGFRHAFLIANPYRPGVIIPTQLPLWLATQMGITHPATLLAVHNAGLIGVPAATWWVALWLRRRDETFWLLALGWVVVELNTGMIPHGEFHLTYALDALVAALLLTPGRRSRGESLLLVIASVLLLRAYETQLFFGPLLAVGAWHGRDSAASPNERRLLAAVVVLLALSGLLGLQALLSPTNPSYVRNSLNLLVLARIGGLVVATAVVGLVVLDRRGVPLLRTRFVRYATPFAIGWLAIPAVWPGLWQFFEVRLAVSVLLATLIAVALFPRRLDRRFGVFSGEASGEERRLVLTLLLVLAIPFSGRALEFHRFLDEIRAATAGRTDIIAVESTAVAKSGMIWDWALPSLSLVVQERANGAVIAPPTSYHGWVPYDSASAHPRYWPRPFDR